MPRFYPPNFTLLCETSPMRLTVEQAVACVRPLLDGRWKPAYKSPISGMDGRLYVEINCHSQRGRYTMVFGVKDDGVCSLWAVLTPGNQQYSVQKDGGNSCTLPEFSPANREKLTKLIITRPYHEEVEFLKKKEEEIKEAIRKKNKNRKQS